MTHPRQFDTADDYERWLDEMEDRDDAEAQAADDAWSERND